eukprot:GFYU01001891.1.p1 GENE.GFYU01001891.1~~GFYU01001891.1.p1  ORF type:complete len:263 (-),score=48.56 GFYU01001891.1:341-1129(-)
MGMPVQAETSYEGDTNDDGKPHGTGVMKYVDHSRYVKYTGDFRNGERHGKGTMLYTSGAVYEGEWVDDVRCGTGTERGSASEPTGTGALISHLTTSPLVNMTRSPLGRETDGPRALARRQRRAGSGSGATPTGVGVSLPPTGASLSSSGGSVDSSSGGGGGGANLARGADMWDVPEDTYTGEWMNDKEHGRGVKYWASGIFRRYEGDWKEGNMTGSWGKMNYRNGDVYEGEWNNSLPHGEGKMVRSSGTVEEGRWENNLFRG